MGFWSSRFDSLPTGPGRASGHWATLGGWGGGVTELSFGHATTKTWSYFGMFGFFRKHFWRNRNVPPPTQITFLKIQWEIHLWNAIFWDETLYKKIQNRNYIALYQKTAFWFDPGPQEVLEPENTQITVFVYFMCFLVWALPEVRDWIQKQFFNEVLYNYCFKFFWGAFCPKNGVPKNALYFQKVIWVGGGNFFLIIFFSSEKPNTLEHAQVLVVMCPKLNSVTALLSPPPPLPPPHLVLP